MRNVIPLDEYFDEMELSEFQRKNRKDFALKIKKGVLTLFKYIEVMREYSTVKRGRAFDMLNNLYLTTLEEYTELDEYLQEYVRDISQKIVDETVDNEDDEYFTSENRALFIAENESNTSFNYIEYRNAILLGKTKKKWFTLNDERVRNTHVMVSDVEVDIGEAFIVGDSLMRYPRDSYYGASVCEIAGCRCIAKYF